MITRLTLAKDVRPDDVLLHEDEQLVVDEVMYSRKVVALAGRPRYRQEGKRVILRRNLDESVTVVADAATVEDCLVALGDLLATEVVNPTVFVRMCGETWDVEFPGGWVLSFPRVKVEADDHAQPTPGPAEGEADPVGPSEP